MADKVNASNIWVKIVEKKCPVCKQNFVIRSFEHVYQIPSRNGKATAYFCSYTCWRKKTKPKEDRERRKIQRELSGKYYTPNGEPIPTTKKEVA